MSGIESSLALAAARCALLFALVSVPRAAHAFSEPRSYYDDSKFGGGGGRWFTASPAEGLGCSVCHTGGGSAKLQVAGLPTAGYAPGATYDVSVAWPEFAARARELRAAPVPGGDPSMGLVAELVSESGLGAGRLEILDPKVANALDLCPSPSGPPTRAAQLYSVRPGEPTEERALSCDAGALGQRCLVAVLACGAEQLRFRWTAPPMPVGPVWFAAGFVTTETVSGSPQGDAVKEYVRPILPAGSNAERYESELNGGCSALESRARRRGTVFRGSAPALRGGALSWAAFLLVATTAVARRARRRAAGRREPG